MAVVMHEPVMHVDAKGFFFSSFCYTCCDAPDRDIIVDERVLAGFE
jgi:hypothetical protein